MGWRVVSLLLSILKSNENDNVRCGRISSTETAGKNYVEQNCWIVNAIVTCLFVRFVAFSCFSWPALLSFCLRHFTTINLIYHFFVFLFVSSNCEQFKQFELMQSHIQMRVFLFSVILLGFSASCEWNKIMWFLRWSSCSIRDCAIVALRLRSFVRTRLDKLSSIRACTGDEPNWI